MSYFPLFMQVRGADCLVVGSGEVAARKAASLVRAGARVHVIAAEPCPNLQELVRAHAVEHRAREYEPEDLARVVLAIVATPERALRERIAADARARRVPVNVVDDPELCTFIMPALVDRSPLLIAISSSGASPVLARIARFKIEAVIPSAFGALAGLCSALRSEVREALPEVSARRRFWENALEGVVAELAISGRMPEAAQALRELLRTAASGGPAPAEVTLVGVGPNDPDLVSLRGLRAMQRADLVLCGARVAESIVELCRRDATRERFVDVSAELMPLIALRAISAARTGARVCVLAVGDGFRSQTGDELCARLTAAGIICQVVPGVAEAISHP